VIIDIHTVGFLMEVQDGGKGQREAHSLCFSPRYLEEEKNDEDGGII
jgi:hypothetical protein